MVLHRARDHSFLLGHFEHKLLPIIYPVILFSGMHKEWKGESFPLIISFCCPTNNECGILISVFKETTIVILDKIGLLSCSPSTIVCSCMLLKVKLDGYLALKCNNNVYGHGICWVDPFENR